MKVDRVSYVTRVAVAALVYECYSSQAAFSVRLALGVNFCYLLGNKYTGTVK